MVIADEYILAWFVATGETTIFARTHDEIFDVIFPSELALVSHKVVEG